MPELPEVEITRQHLAAALPGRSLVSVSMRHARTARHNHGSLDIVEQRLTGRRVLDVRRLGKYLVIPLDDGMTIVAHLGMSGRFSIASPEDPVEIHTHFVAELDDGTSLRFVDPRTFGFIAVHDDAELETSGIARIGPDAWEDPPAPLDLAAALRGRTAPIKALLLDQGHIAGLGNIYADEALFRAGIDPRTPGGEVTEVRIGLLLDAIREVLAVAISNGGTSLDDLAYLLPDGRAGENLRQLKVYGRDGEPCYECGEIIDKVVIRSRSTHFCPRCQAPDVG